MTAPHPPEPAADPWLSPGVRRAEAAVPAPFDLTACVREEIHLLGGIQSHGTLLAVDPVDGRVVLAARNTEEHLGAPAETLLGRPVTDLLPAEDHAEALALTEGPQLDGAPAAVLRTTVTRPDGTTRPLDLSAHRRDGLLVLELEPPAEPAGPGDPARFHQGIRRALVRLRSADTVAEACRRAVAEIRALTGYDRVVAYRFEGEDGPGEVVAEERAEDLEPWLGLWFPATDIPPQARRLYLSNWIRAIHDVDDESVPLHPSTLPATGRPLDLSGSALRTVSEFHLEYLRNIDVRASMSVSVLRDDRLWGLIACHGRAPLPIGPELRAACELFACAFSLQLAALAERGEARALDEARTRVADLAIALTAEVTDTSGQAVLLEQLEPLRSLLNAESLVLVHGGAGTVHGAPVPPEVLAALTRHAAEARDGEPRATDRLAEAAGGPPGGPAGALVIPLGPHGELLAWLRAERPVPRSWAADPDRPVRVGPRGERLTPRGSGAVFRETVRGRSLPWTTTDLAIARELRRLLTGLVLRHSAVLRRVNEELRLSNEDLDSFAHAAAHDLKEPLRGISNAATFVLEDAEGLDPVTVRRLTTMRRLAGRMDDLLNSLLAFDRLGRGAVRPAPVSLDRALDAALEVAGPRLAAAGVEVVRPGPLPSAAVDPHLLAEVFVNLLVNAAKYAADRPDRRVEVAACRATPPDGSGEHPVVRVRDNGIGIPAEQHEEVFALFRRLHGPEERGGGTGVGLAVVKRVIERHGGRLWLESAPGEGAAFYLLLPSEDSPIRGCQ
ncbi:ATP-binding protein [Streptomyces sp. BI20]|uniref:ATP-binding protein n=1 Tax=Streptomyces sp. BI20 TaxID=3403460 RepID=UPI003C75CDDE